MANLSKETVDAKIKSIKDNLAIFQEKHDKYIKHDLEIENKQMLLDIDNLTESEKWDYLQKNYNSINLKEMILTKEVMTYKPDQQDMTLDEFTKTSQMILARYTNVLNDNYHIEDKDWTMYTYNEQRKCHSYHLKENEIVFENTIINEYYNDNSILFVKRLADILNNLSTSVNVSYTFNRAYRDKLYWAILICSYKPKKLVITNPINKL